MGGETVPSPASGSITGESKISRDLTKLVVVLVGRGLSKEIKSLVLTEMPLTIKGVVSMGAGGRSAGATVFNRGTVGNPLVNGGSCCNILGKTTEGSGIVGGPMEWLVLLTGAVEGPKMAADIGATPGALVVETLIDIWIWYVQSFRVQKKNLSDL
jgi:hypothetical protein